MESRKKVKLKSTTLIFFPIAVSLAGVRRYQEEWAGELAPGDNTGRLPTERIIYHAAKKEFCQDFQKVARGRSLKTINHIRCRLAIDSTNIQQNHCSTGTMSESTSN